MKNSRFLWVGGSALLLPLLVILVPWYPLQLSAGLLLMAFVPGYALLLALWPSGSAFTDLEQWLIAPPISFSLTIIYLLLLVLARWPLNVVTIAGGLGGLTLLFTLIAWWRMGRAASDEWPVASRKSQVANASPSIHYPLSSIFYLLSSALLIAAFFRLINIHYSDYQGDEADILWRAISLVYGQTEAILTHSKGPGEILLLNAIGALTGRFDEQTARLPFALAGVISIGLLVWLGQQLFNRWVGWIAGLLAAIDGVFVSYARTAQYQSLVLLLTLAALYCFYRFYQSEGHSRRWHSLGALLLAASCLFHFETILLLPVVAYLTLAPVMRRGREDAMRRGTEAQPKSYASRSTHHASRITFLWPSLLIFIIPVTAFYLPFLLHPSISSTGVYLENRISGGTAPPFNNLAHFFYYEALKYNSAYYVILFNMLLGGVVLAALVLELRNEGSKELIKNENRSVKVHFDTRPPLFSKKKFLLCLTVVLLILGGFGLALLGQSQLSALALALGFGMFFVMIILSPRTDLSQRVLWLWLAPPFLVYVFLVNRPGKHHYLFLGALTILVAWAVVRGWQWTATHWPGLRQPAGRWLTAGVGLALLLVFAGNTVLIFLRNDLEYILTYPAHKSAFYPTDADFPYGTRIGFGYPFRLGWQLIGQLRRAGQLSGDWGSNDDGNAPRWYMLGVPYTPCYPRYVLRGDITYKGDEDFDVPFDPANFGYRPAYRLWGNGQLRMTILEFDPTGQTEAVDLYETARFDPPVTAADFAVTLPPQETSPRPEMVLDPPLVLGEGSELKNNAPPEYVERAKELAGRVALVGYDVDERFAQPGSIVPITLYWQAQSLLSLRYKVFVHLLSSSLEGGQGEVVAQADDFPVCGASPTNTWSSGALLGDRHLLKLPPDLPPGDYILLVGMYEPDLNLRLNHFDAAGNEQGNSLTVGKLQIR